MSPYLSHPRRSLSQAQQDVAARDKAEPGWLQRWFSFRWSRAAQPTTFHKNLAIHMHFAAPRSALRD